MVKRASPGMTLTAPGSTSSRPTVATRSPSLRARCSTIRIISAAALAASHRLLDAAERGERAEIAVIAAGVAHRVDMRADHQRRRARRLALVARPDIAGGVDLRGEAGLRSPGHKLLRRLPMGVG